MGRNAYGVDIVLYLTDEAMLQGVPYVTPLRDAIEMNYKGLLVAIPRTTQLPQRVLKTILSGLLLCEPLAYYFFLMA